MLKTDINDTNCCALFAKGQSEAYHYLIRIYFPVLCHYANNIVEDQMAAEDIVDEVFIKLWEQKPSFEHINEIKKFLYVAVKNASLNFLRSEKRAEQRHQVFLQKYTEDGASDARELLFHEMLSEVRKALDSLPDKMREVFILAYVKQLSNQQIAETLNLSYQTVRNQKSQSIIRLKKRLGSQGFSSVLLMIGMLF